MLTLLLLVRRKPCDIDEPKESKTALAHRVPMPTICGKREKKHSPAIQTANSRVTQGLRHMAGIGKGERLRRHSARL